MVIYFLTLFVLFAAQITLAWRFSIFGASPDFIFSFFAASFLLMKDKRLIWPLAFFAGFLVSVYSPPPAAVHVSFFLISAAILVLAWKFLSETVRKPLILILILPLAASREIFVLAAGSFLDFLGFTSSNAAFSTAFSRKILWLAILNFLCAVIFYFCVNFFRKHSKI